jgi:hypothetical protein
MRYKVQAVGLQSLAVRSFSVRISQLRRNTPAPPAAGEDGASLSFAKAGPDQQGSRAGDDQK